MMSVFGRKGPTLFTNDPIDSGRDAVREPDAAGAVHRRLLRALADLGIAPQPVGPRVANWANLVDGVVTFGALSVETAARLTNLLEDIAAGRINTGSTSERDSIDDDNHDAASRDFAPPFEPVAPPFDPVTGPSRLHPRVAN